MKFFKSGTNICFLAIIFLTVLALILCCFIIHKKENEITTLSDKVAVTESALEETQKKIEEIEKKFNESNASLNAELEKAKSEKAALEKERDSLKAENNTLKSANAKLTAQHQEKARATETAASVKGPKICYLTFDDGPSDNTLKILEILKQHNAKATFFVINTSKIDYIKNIHADGHTVGLHTSTHAYQNIYASEAAYYADLKAISDKVKSIIGVESKIIRFPGGSSNKISEKYCKGLMKTLIKTVPQKGYFYYDWNVDSCDAEGTNVSYTKIRDGVLTSAINKNSICVLMHDSEAKGTTVKALPEILTGLKKQGYIFKALTKDSYGYHHNVT